MNSQSTSNSHSTQLVIAIAASLLVSVTPAGQTKDYPLDSASGLRLQNLIAQPAVLQRKKGLRLTSDEAARKQAGLAEIEQPARIDGLEFSNGTIEAEMSDKWPRGRPGATQPCGAVHLASAMDVAASSPGNAVQVRVLRRPGSW